MTKNAETEKQALEAIKKELDPNQFVILSIKSF